MHFPMWLFFALITLIFFGLSGDTQKLATNEISMELSYFWFVLAMLLIALAIVILVPLDWHIRSKIVVLAMAGGLLNGLGAMTSFKALEVGGKASIVVPLCYLYPLVAIFLALVFLHEKLTGTEVAGIALAVVAAFLLAQERQTEPPAPGGGRLP